MYTFVGDGFFSQSRLSRHNCRVNKPENTRMIASYFTLNNSYKETQVLRYVFFELILSDISFPHCNSGLQSNQKEFDP